MLEGILSRICRCLAGAPREREPSATPAGDAVGEERAEAEGQAPGEGPGGVTAIQGIGITMQNRLNRAGITTYAQLAEAKPEHVREVLGGKLSRGANVDAWISRARELVAGK